MSPNTEDVVVEARTMDLPEETRLGQAPSSLIASSNQGSITYPYRTLLKDTSFPRCHLMAKPGSDAEAYTGSLSMLGYGIPLWEPIGNLDRPKEQLISGISVGDVGFLDRDGTFRCYFNLFLPPEHPAQFYCPPDLVPLQSPSVSEISVNPMQFARGTTLVSNGIDASTISSSPLDIKFTVNGREGGILVLPDGASREELLSTTHIREYVKNHVLNWYVFYREGLGAVVHPNGTLYVVTSTDKATTWASCVTSTEHTSVHQMWKPPTITYRGARGDSPHRWETEQETGKQFSYKRSREIENVGTCALFVRGIRFAVNVRDWTQHVLHYKIPEEIPFCVIRTVPNFGLRARVQTLKECRAGYRQLVPPEDGIGIRIMFHPLDVILRLLLEEAPSSSVAYVEDHIWSSVADKSDATLSAIDRLLIKVLETHKIFVEDDMVTLISRKVSSQEQVTSPLSRSWVQPFNYIQRTIRTWGHRRAILRRLASVFPGPQVPAKILQSTRQDELF